MVTLSGRQNSDKWYSQHSSCFSQTPQTWSNILHTRPLRENIYNKIFLHKNIWCIRRIFLRVDAHFRAWLKDDYNDIVCYDMRPKTKLKSNLASPSRPTISHNTFTEKIIYPDLEHIFGSWVIFWPVSLLEDDNVGVTRCFLESAAPLSSLLSSLLSQVLGAGESNSK